MVRGVHPALCSWALAGSLALAACSGGAPSGPPLPLPSAPATMTLASSAFRNGGAIPSRFTCDGVGVPPPLTWRTSSEAGEFVLLVIDPDAPGGTFVHWLMYSIPPETDSLGEGQGPAGAKQGTNDFGQARYGPPCPPPGDAPHHYVFSIYALSAARTGGVPSGAAASTVLADIRCCVQELGTLTGTYRR